MTNAITRYPLILRLLHWTIALAMLFMIGLGWYIAELDYEDTAYQMLRQWHRTIGCALFPLGIINLVAYATLPRPQFSASLTPGQRSLARLVHYFLLYATIAIPVAGYLMSGDKLVIVGDIHVPALVVLSKTLRGTLFEVHETLAWLTLVLAILHAGAAIKHHAIDKDDTLTKMRLF